MRWREFITVIAGAASAWPFGAGAQQTTKLPMIGFMGSSTPSMYAPWVNAFLDRLRERGWTDGRLRADRRLSLTRLDAFESRQLIAEPGHLPLGVAAGA